MQNSTLVWVIVIALLVLGGGWYFLNNQSAPAGGQEEVGETENEDSDNAGAGLGASAGADVMVGGGGGTEESAAPMNASVTYSSAGFAPSTVTVKVGGTVTWSAQGGAQMWVASAQHPTHSVYDGTTLQEHCGTGSASGAFDQCASGTSYSFTFNKAGTWRYHNHSNSSHFGTVIVEE